MLTNFGIAGMGHPHPNAGEFSIFHTRNYGTPGYAAPEQLAGNTAAVAQDIYGIGATIYCLLVGDPLAEATPERQQGWAGPMGRPEGTDL